MTMERRWLVGFRSAINSDASAGQRTSRHENTGNRASTSWQRVLHSPGRLHVILKSWRRRFLQR